MLQPKDKKQRKTFSLMKNYSIISTSYELKRPIMNIPINQLLKTVLKIMNEKSVYENVPWRTIHKLQQNYRRINDKHKLF